MSDSPQTSPAEIPTSAPVHALMLLGRWTRIAQQGALPIGGMSGCSCCAGFDFLPVASIEIEVLDFLDGRHGATAGIGALLREQAGYRPNEAGRIVDLLKVIGGGKSGVPEAALGPLLVDLQMTVDSLDDIANGRML